MSVSITTIASSDLVSDSRGTINTNFGNLKTAVETLQAAGAAVAFLTTSAFDTATSTATVHGGYDLVHLTDAPYTCVWTGSAWTFYYANKLVTPMANGSFSWSNQDSASVTVTNRVVRLSKAGGGGDALRCRLASVPGATPYSVTATVLLDFPAQNYASAGLCITDGTKLCTVVASYNSGEAFRGYKFNSTTSYSASNAFSYYRAGLCAMKPVYLRMRNDGTNLILSFSLDGSNYFIAQTAGVNAFIAGAPTTWGLCLNTTGLGSDETVAMSVLGWDVGA